MGLENWNKKEIFQNVVAVARTAALITAVSAFAFTKDVHKKIMQRANYSSEWSGDRYMPLEASHLDHTRDQNYNTPDNGEAVTVEEHLAYHTYWRKNPRYIGLDASANEWAIRKLRERVKSFYSTSGVQVSNMDVYIDQRLVEVTEEYRSFIDPESMDDVSA